MGLKSYLTINEVLKRKHFNSCEVIAGKVGLTNRVKWVHVMEVTRVNELLKGNELILSTGVGWKEDNELCLSFLKQLIECQASGLCIELGTYTSQIPQNVIEFANQHEFPIILFHEEVPFVEITQDLHALLVNQHYLMISDLENYSQQLNQMLLSVNDPKDILQHLCESTGLLAGLRIHNEVILFPACLDLPQQQLLQHHITEQNKNQSSFFTHSIQLLGESYAELHILSTNDFFTELEMLTVDRTATALAQHFLRDLYVEEKKRVQETEWMVQWVNGEISSSQITHYLQEVLNDFPIQGGTIVCCQCVQDVKVDHTYLKLTIRAIFEQEGFHLLILEKKRELVLVVLNKRQVTTWRERLEKSLNRWINHGDLQEVNKSLGVQLIGVGQFNRRLDYIHKGYETAKKTVSIQMTLHNETKNHICFYEDLHMYRIISLVNEQQELQEVVMEYLQPVLEYDRKFNAKLFETLKVYLACNGSKQETAKRLYIVRQTLYHRIEKLEKLLGSDFMVHEKRMAIEFMIMTYDYLFALNASTTAINKLGKASFT